MYLGKKEEINLRKWLTFLENRNKIKKRTKKLDKIYYYVTTSELLYFLRGPLRLLTATKQT